MQTEQIIWTKQSGWNQQPVLLHPQCVFVFFHVDLIHEDERFQQIRTFYPNAHLLYCSTAGEIGYNQMMDETILVTALQFEHTQVRVWEEHLSSFSESKACGTHIAQALKDESLKAVFILSEGSITNGDHLVEGMRENLPENTIIVGGMAGDAGRFQKTYVGLNHLPGEGNIVAMALYGERIEVKTGCEGGWTAFGPIRTITHSHETTLFTLDNQPALEVYKRYLGDRAKELPSAALRFPLCLYMPNGKKLVRTILRINEENASMTFAGSVPKGIKAQFMLASNEEIIEGAEIAAKESLGSTDPDVVFVVSCVGRRIVLGERTEEELEAISRVYPNQPAVFGFYSNGEIAPMHEDGYVVLHNQSMTITTLTEK